MNSKVEITYCDDYYKKFPTSQPSQLPTSQPSQLPTSQPSQLPSSKNYDKRNDWNDSQLSQQNIILITVLTVLGGLLSFIVLVFAFLYIRAKRKLKIHDRNGILTNGQVLKYIINREYEPCSNTNDPQNDTGGEGVEMNETNSLKNQTSMLDDSSGSENVNTPLT